MNILFIVPYPEGEAPSQRFRFEQYFKILNKQGWQYKVVPFWGNRTWRILYESGHYYQKSIGLFKGWLKRVALLFQLSKYEFIFLHREALPFGPAVYEWLLSKVFKKKIIYDFDDAIWIANASEENKFIAQLKWHSKIKRICSMANKISCGNEFLIEFAKNYNDDVIHNPTTVDTDDYHNIIKGTSEEIPVIGWTGTHSTLPFLNSFISVLRKLEQNQTFTFLVISDKNPDYDLNDLQTINWDKDTEIKDLLKIDIGVMPMPDNDWTRGKCGLKILQYMALGIPPLASPVGVNTKIIDHGINGFICESDSDWEKYISQLIQDKELRTSMGEKARGKVISDYAVSSNASNFLDLFK